MCIISLYGSIVNIRYGVRHLFFNFTDEIALLR